MTNQITETQAMDQIHAIQALKGGGRLYMTRYEGLKNQWESDAALRAEFGGDFKCYQAYANAEREGHARILKPVVIS